MSQPFEMTEERIAVVFERAIKAGLMEKMITLDGRVMYRLTESAHQKAKEKRTSKKV